MKLRDNNNINIHLLGEGGWSLKSSEALKNSFSSGNTGDAIGSITGAVGTIADATVKNALIADLTQFKNDIEEQTHKLFYGADNDALLEEYKAAGDLAHLSYRDVRGLSKGLVVGNVFGATASGASAGAKIGGPWGAVIGAAVGLGTSMGGAFGGRAKAKRALETLNNLIDLANTIAANSFTNRLNNVENNNQFNMAAHYSALGGPINHTYEIGGPIEYEALQDLLNMLKKYYKALGILADGGRIRESNSADFIGSNGTNWNTGYTEFNTGGTHESNPNDGILQGIAPDGLPNKVEEGEVKFNDFIYSNRIMATEKELEQYNLPKLYKDSSIAYIAEKLSQDLKERPNDTLTNKAVSTNLQRLATLQEEKKALLEKRKAERAIKNMTPEQLQMMLEALQGELQQMNELQMAEEEALLLLAMQEAQMNELPMMAKGGHLFANGDNIIAANPYYSSVNDVPTIGNGNSNYNVYRNIPIDNNPDYSNITLAPYPLLGLEVKLKNSFNNPVLDFYQLPTFTDNDKLIGNSVSTTPQVTTNNSSNNQNSKSLPTWMRYSPLVGDAMNIISAFSDRPDIEGILRSERVMMRTPGMTYTPISNYQLYRPLDINYQLNKLNALSLATRSAIMNSVNGNPLARNAALLAADYNALNLLGDLGIKAFEYNNTNRDRVENFNRATNQANAQMSMQAQQYNSALQAEKAKYIEAMDALIRAEKLRVAAGRSNALSGLFEDLGSIGNENFAMNQVNSRRDLNYGTGVNGISYVKTPNGEIVDPLDYKFYAETLGGTRDANNRFRYNFNDKDEYYALSDITNDWRFHDKNGNIIATPEWALYKKTKGGKLKIYK